MPASSSTSVASSCRTSRSSSPCSRLHHTPASSRPSTSGTEPKQLITGRLSQGRRASMTSSKPSSVGTRSHLKTYPTWQNVSQQRSIGFGMTTENPFVSRCRRSRPFPSHRNVLHPPEPASPSSAPLLVPPSPASPTADLLQQHEQAPTIHWLFPSTRAKRYEKMEDPGKPERSWRRTLFGVKKPKVTTVQKDDCSDTGSVRRYKARRTGNTFEPNKCCGWKLFGLRKDLTGLCRV